MTERNETKQWFSQMVKDNMDALYGVALRLTGCGTNAEDLVAETVIKAWSRIDTLEDRGRWRPWVFRILHNEFISNYRKAAVRPSEVPFEEQATDGTDSVVSMLMDQSDEFLKWWANPEQEYINSLLGKKIHEAIDRLPEVFRVTILLVNVEGFSYDEAAVVLGVPCGTVRSRMKRGRILLQKALWLQAQEAGLNKTGT
ncbi:MAG: RNA polymerase sigma factor [Xanthomonadales bacterium]|nr:RNA polymerase sigma factor [Xanthomonadales bacterium]